VKKSIVS